MAENNGVIFCGTEGGLYFSNNEGISWTHAPKKWTSVWSLINWGDTLGILYYGYDNSTFIDPHKIYFQLSYDFGQTWQDSIVVSSWYSGSISGSLRKVEKSILFFDHDGSMKYSLDFGQTIKNVPTNDSINNPSPDIHSYSIDKGKLIYSFFHANGVDTKLYNYCSFDTLHSFSQFDTSFAQLVLIDSTILGVDIIVVPKALKISHNLGQTWDTIPAFPSFSNANSAFFFNKTASSIYMTRSSSTPNSIDYFVSHDKGNTWQPTLTYTVKYDTVAVSNNQQIGLHGELPKKIVVLDANDQIVGTRMEGIYSGTFTRSRTTNNKLYTHNSESVYFTEDNSASWNKLTMPKMYWINYFNIFNDTLYAFSELSLNLYKSGDYGLSWDTITLPEQGFSAAGSNLSFFVWGSKYIYSTKTYENCWISHDFGVTWDTLNVPVNYYLRLYKDKLFSINRNGNLYNLNTSLEWDSLVRVPAGGGNSYPQFFQIEDKIIYASYSYLNNCLISSDSANTWNQITMTGIPGAGINNMIPYNGYWYAIESGNAIYASNDNGLNWAVVANNGFIPNTDLDTLNGVLYATSKSNGIWRFSGNQMTAVSGKAFYDLNKNGTQDVSDPPCANATINLVAQNTATLTNINGDYSFFSINNSDSLQCTVLNSLAAAVPTIQHFTGNNNQLNFALQFDSTAYDASVYAVTPLAVAGFNMFLNVNIKNNALPISGGLLKILPHENVTLSASSISDTAISFSGDTILYQIGTMAFQEQFALDFEFDSLVGYNIGDTIQFEVWFISNETDLIPSNNYQNVIGFVVSSYDPNDKQCLTGTYFTPQQLLANEEIKYQIRFENTGNYYAQIVRILDTLSAYLDPSTLRILSSSHPTNFTIKDQVVNFYFPGICLPSIEQDSVLNKGYVAFAIKCKSSAAQFDIVNNAADIYFDFNTPIHTNTVTTFIDYPPAIVTSLFDTNLNQGFKVYPNPFNDFTIVTANKSAKIKSITLNSILGAEIWRQDFNTSIYQHQLLMNEFSDGIYFLTVLGEDGDKSIFKLVKRK
jgi:hypothetical protein